MKNLGLTVQRVDSVKSVARSGLCLSGRLAQPYNIEAFEIPIPQSNIDGYLEIQRGCEMPITIHFGNPDPVKAIKAGMNDSFIIVYPESRAANVKREATIAESAPFISVDPDNDNVFDAPCCNDDQRHYVVDYVKLPESV